MSQVNRPLMLHSGADRADYLRLLAKEQSAALIHAKDARRPKLLAMLQELQQEYHLIYVLDCGYKKKLTLEQYALLLISLQEQAPTLFAWYASQDEIGDQEASNVNYEKLLLLCASFQEKIMWIYQVKWGSKRERAQHLQHLETMCRKLTSRETYWSGRYCSDYQTEHHRCFGRTPGGWGDLECVLSMGAGARLRPSVA